MTMLRQQRSCRSRLRCPLSPLPWLCFRRRSIGLLCRNSPSLRRLSAVNSWTALCHGHARSSLPCVGARASPLCSLTQRETRGAAHGARIRATTTIGGVIRTPTSVASVLASGYRCVVPGMGAHARTMTNGAMPTPTSVASALAVGLHPEARHQARGRQLMVGMTEPAVGQTQKTTRTHTTVSTVRQRRRTARGSASLQVAARPSSTVQAMAGVRFGLRRWRPARRSAVSTASGWSRPPIARSRTGSREWRWTPRRRCRTCAALALP
mmetsp:Transcript_147853/g.411758  ORF Transcript_147853/g.411758 Transcript_147853/m.411758 type:complete len:267 (+) Transcript_147853:283-1083(+)